MTTLALPRPQAISAFSRTKSVVKMRLQGFLVQLGQAGRPATVVELFQVELGLAQVPVPLVALGQAGNALAATLQRLNELLAVAAQAQRDLGTGPGRGPGYRSTG